MWVSVVGMPMERAGSRRAQAGWGKQRGWGRMRATEEGRVGGQSPEGPDVSP